MRLDQGTLPDVSTSSARFLRVLSVITAKVAVLPVLQDLVALPESNVIRRRLKQ